MALDPEVVAQAIAIHRRKVKKRERKARLWATCEVICWAGGGPHKCGHRAPIRKDGHMIGNAHHFRIPQYAVFTEEEAHELYLARRRRLQEVPEYERTSV